MARYLHDDRFLYPCFSHIGVKRMSQVMEDEPILCEPSIRNLCFFAGIGQRLPDILDGSSRLLASVAPVKKHVVIMDRPGNTLQDFI